MEPQTSAQREKLTQVHVASALEDNCVLDLFDSQPRLIVCVRPSETEPESSFGTRPSSAFLYRASTEQVNQEFLEELKTFPQRKITPLEVTSNPKGYTFYHFDFFEDGSRVRLVVQNLHSKYYHP